MDKVKSFFETENIVVFNNDKEEIEYDEGGKELCLTYIVFNKKFKALAYISHYKNSKDTLLNLEITDLEEPIFSDLYTLVKILKGEIKVKKNE